MSGSAWQPGSSLVANSNATIAPQSFAAAVGQSSFVLTNFAYVPNTSSLWVFVNGVFQTSGVDYLETSSSQIDFVSPMQGGELVTLVGMTAVTGSGVGSNPATFSSLLINKNASAAAPAVISAATIVQIVGADASGPVVELDGFANPPTLALRRANGTNAAKTGLLLNDTLGGINVYGYGATAYSPSQRGQIAFQAAENWTDAAQGTQVVISNTGAGTIVSRPVAIFAENGVFYSLLEGMSIPNTKSYKVGDSGGTSRSVLSLDAGNNIILNNSGAGITSTKINFAGATVAAFNGSGAVVTGTFSSSGTLQAGTASANFLSVTGIAAGNNPFIYPGSSADANVGVTLVGKGTGSIDLSTNDGIGNVGLRVLANVSSTRAITAKGSNGGNSQLNTTAGSLDLGSAGTTGVVTIGTTGANIAGTVDTSSNITTSGGQITAGVVGTSGVQIINTGVIGTLDAQDLIFRRAATEFARGTSTLFQIASGFDLKVGRANVALGGGAAPTFGTIGGSGPATAAQNSWMKLIDTTGAAVYVPIWK